MARVGFVGVLSFVALCLILGLERSEGVVHSVGDSTGWGSPPNSDFYDDWADRRIFRVGDQLCEYLCSSLIFINDWFYYQIMYNYNFNLVVWFLNYSLILMVSYGVFFFHR